MLLSVLGWTSGKVVQVKIVNFPAMTVALDWTSVGVVESANGEGKSVYGYNFALTPGSEYIIHFKDNSAPIKTASYVITAMESTVGALDDLVDAVYAGKWVIDPTGKTLTLYKADGVTVLKIIDLTSTTAVIPTFIQGVPRA